MKKIQHIAFASVLALALSATAFAGDITVSKHKAGDITVSKATSGDITGKADDITIGGLIGIIQTLMSIIP